MYVAMSLMLVWCRAGHFDITFWGYTLWFGLKLKEDQDFSGG